MAKRKGGRPEYITFRFPDRPPRKYRQTTGHLSGMGICQFIAAIFEVNETLPKKKKFTDATITQMIVREFADRNPVKRLIKGELTIGYWRTLFNQGLLTGQKHARELPQRPSRRYNAEGEMVNPRTGRVPKPEELRWLLEKERKLQEKLRALVAAQLADEERQRAEANEELSSPQVG